MSPELLDLLRRWAEAPDDSAVQAQMAAALGDFQPLPQRPWRTFPVRSVLAILLWHAEQHQKALELAFAAIARSGRDDAAMQVVNSARAMLYDMAMRWLHHKRPDFSRHLLDGNIRLFSQLLDLAPERSLLALTDYVAQAETAPPAPRTPPEGRATVISLAVWGDRFIAAAERTFLPCCLAAGNVPALKSHGTVYLRIHTRAEDIARLEALPVVRALAEHAFIDLQPIAPALLDGTHLHGKHFFSRLLIAGITYADVMFARHIGADLMFGGADVLIAGGAYGAVKRRLIEGYRAVVMQPVRGVAGEVERRLEAQRCRKADGSFDIPADRLYRASLEALHPLILQSFMRRMPTPLAVDPIQFYFTTAEGFALRSFQLSILGLAGRHVPADLGCDYHTTDCRLLSDLLVGADRATACYMDRRMPAESYVVGLDEVGGMTAFGDFELSPAGAARSIQKWMGRPEDMDYFQWSIQQRFEYPTPDGVTLALPNDCRDEEGAVAEAAALLEAERPAILNSLAQYASRSG